MADKEILTPENTELENVDITAEAETAGAVSENVGEVAAEAVEAAAEASGKAACKEEFSNTPSEPEGIEKQAEEHNVMSPWALGFFKKIFAEDDTSGETKEKAKEDKPHKKISIKQIFGNFTADEPEGVEMINFVEEAEKQKADAEAEAESGVADEKEVQGVGVNFLVLFIAFAVVIVITVFATFFVAKKMFVKNVGVKGGSTVSFADESLDPQKTAKLQYIIDFIKQNYYKDFDMDELVEGAIEGMVDALEDPYGGYYPPDTMDSYTSFIEGSYTGVGIKAVACDSGMKVAEIIADTPAAEAGFVAGDIITHINGQEVKKLSSEQINSMLGVAGKEIKLKGIRADGVTAFDIGLTVKTVVTATVHYKELDNNVKYIYISQFTPGTAEKFKEAVEKAASESCRGIIIDLRGNPGGYEHEASAVADMILPEGTIATSRDRDDKILRTVTSDKNEITAPVVLLVNQDSASAAELVAGAFRDFKKGEIVGVHTYGKALAQINKDFEADGSGIVLTTSRYFTPSGECIDGVGIAPTVQVELPEEFKKTKPSDIPFESDTQLAKAIEIIEDGAEG